MNELRPCLLVSCWNKWYLKVDKSRKKSKITSFGAPHVVSRLKLEVWGWEYKGLRWLYPTLSSTHQSGGGLPHSSVCPCPLCWGLVSDFTRKNPKLVKQQTVMVKLCSHLCCKFSLIFSLEAQKKETMKHIPQQRLRVPLWLCSAAKWLSPVCLFCNPGDCSPPSSSVHGMTQVRILEWVAISFCRGSSWPTYQDLPDPISTYWYIFTYVDI